MLAGGFGNDRHINMCFKHSEQESSYKRMKRITVAEDKLTRKHYLIAKSSAVRFFLLGLLSECR